MCEESKKESQIRAADFTSVSALVREILVLLESGHKLESREKSDLTAREWLCGGGGGFEDGEAGIRACTMSAEHAIELMDEFADFKVEAGRRDALEEQTKANECVVCGASLEPSEVLPHCEDCIVTDEI